MNSQKFIASMPDRFVPLSEAVIPIWESSNADGTAEPLRIVGGKLWLLDEHLDRMANSLRIAYLQWPSANETEWYFLFSIASID